MKRPVHSRALRVFAIALAALATSVVTARAGSLPTVFAGDPVGPNGQPYIVLPGVPRVDWGVDQKWGTADDVINPAIIGDVDLVVRTGGTFVPGNPIPPPAQGVANAPEVVAGGLQFPSSGSEVPYQFILSDGAASPSAGHPLSTHDLDGRGTVALAFADLDGDGILGPTNADPDGAADNALEAQEALMVVGRRLGVISGGVSSGSLGVSLGLPRSTGGLGVVIAGGALTGAVPPLYKDGPWIATLLPCMWPLDPNLIIGSANARAPDPNGLVDVEVSQERLFRPSPGHPILGTPYAIPLNGSSVTTDLARAVSGPAEAVAFARPLDPATFVPDQTRRVQPVVGADGKRHVVEPVFATNLADDGPGNAATLLVYPADVLGNQADPPPGGGSVRLSASANLRIVAPDTDGDPQHETIAFGAAGFALVTLDDAGGAGDGGATGRVVATLDGATAGSLRVDFGNGSPQGVLLTATARLRRNKSPQSDRLDLTATMASDLTTLDLDHQNLSVTLSDALTGSVFYTRTFPAKSLTQAKVGGPYRTGEPATIMVARLVHLVIRRSTPAASPIKLKMRVTRLDLSAVGAGTSSIVVSVSAGTHRFESTLGCTQSGGGGTTTRCAL